MQQTLDREAEWKLLKHPNKGIVIITAVCILNTELMWFTNIILLFLPQPHFAPTYEIF